MRTKNGPANAAIDSLIAASSLIGMEMDGSGAAACISFADYMATCLYDPSAGYYRSGAPRVGKRGDFYTSSGLGDLMARSIAASIDKWRDAMPSGEERLLIAEWGAGTGRLSAQLAAVLG
ncbi:MAG: SAM-dependent methyltransferase, partial [Paenibacillus sp.]|nr:SAM-dependent methyltransferase [Paenibacillus sp.]